tara:strand:- start:82 stop:228 length:147 start_codon:yes stop_codon:yes gene_type:complete
MKAIINPPKIQIEAIRDVQPGNGEDRNKELNMRYEVYIKEIKNIEMPI